MHPAEPSPDSDKKSPSHLKSTGVVGSYTMLSRILGLLRDVVIANFIGASASADAFFVADGPDIGNGVAGSGDEDILHQAFHREGIIGLYARLGGVCGRCRFIGVAPVFSQEW